MRCRWCHLDQSKNYGWTSQGAKFVKRTRLWRGVSSRQIGLSQSRVSSKATRFAMALQTIMKLLQVTSSCLRVNSYCEKSTWEKYTFALSSSIMDSPVSTLSGRIIICTHGRRLYSIVRYSMRRRALLQWKYGEPLMIEHSFPPSPTRQWSPHNSTRGLSLHT